MRSLTANRKSRQRHVQAYIKRATVLVLVAALIFALPKLVGPGFFHDQARGAMAFAAAVGEWIRVALVSAFQSIPTR